MVTTATITTADVSRAQKRIDDCTRAWDRYGRRSVNPAELTEAKTRIGEGHAELSQWHTWAWRRKHILHSVLAVLTKLRVIEFGWLPVGLITGTTTAVLAAIPVLLTVRGLGPIYFLLVCAFLFGFAAIAVILFPTRHVDARTTFATITASLKDRQSKIAIMKDRLRGWESHLATLREVRTAEEAYQRAVADHQALLDRLNDRRYQLQHANWRAMRDTDFEDFVAEIFQQLGYRVQKTKVTGDQGVDLIVEGKGRLIAVQTKGYEKSVGNKAIQEAYAGMAFYRCNECVAVTNSRFTRAAKTLASSVGCRLVDEYNLRELIDGRLY